MNTAAFTPTHYFFVEYMAYFLLWETERNSRDWLCSENRKMVKSLFPLNFRLTLLMTWSLLITREPNLLLDSTCGSTIEFFNKQVRVNIILINKWNSRSFFELPISKSCGPSDLPIKRLGDSPSRNGVTTKKSRPFNYKNVHVMDEWHSPK